MDERTDYPFVQSLCYDKKRIGNYESTDRCTETLHPLLKAGCFTTIVA